MTIQFQAAPGLPLPPGGAAPAAVVLGGGTCTLYSARVYFFHRKIEMSRSEPRVDLGWAKGLTLQEVVVQCRHLALHHVETLNCE